MAAMAAKTVTRRLKGLLTPRRHTKSFAVGGTPKQPIHESTCLRSCHEPTLEKCRNCNVYPCNRLMLQHLEHNSDASHRVWLWAFAGFAGLAIMNTEQVPITKRWRVQLIPQPVAQMLDQEYDDYMATSLAPIALPEDHPAMQRVTRVAQRLCEVNNITGLRLFVVDDATQENAFVSPGGCVLVYTGLLDLLDNDDQLAVVLAHEMAHYVAKHSSERTFVDWIRKSLDYLTSSHDGDAVDKAAALSLTLPQSRLVEREADHIGLIMLSRACFDLSQVANAWARLHASKAEDKPGQTHHHGALQAADKTTALQSFLSDTRDADNAFDALWMTHPTHQERIAHFIEGSDWMIEARQEQERYKCGVCPPSSSSMASADEADSLRQASDGPLRPLPWWQVMYKELMSR
eukprot:TRINITY_DN12153_c0_g1_i1.p1 TRINITY_DN12153_c0_g1~~TRINITY_DN12153_c0_g1_i1.p1  ORF type:complete len:404 (+),score=52.97 TRINITY_DN12153_c0_g1_i1:1441-2652(+)